MRELVPLSENDSAIPAKLDVAQRALAEATDDWQRVDIRDYARAVAAATAILKRKNIQVQAANLVQDAERAIAKANPPMSRSEIGKLANKSLNEKRHGVSSGKSLDGNKPSSEPLRDKDREIVKNNLITVPQLREIRRNHKYMSDEEFEAKKAEAIQTGVPLTHSVLREESRRKRQAQEREERDEQLTQQATLLPTGEQKYTVIYADPPWRYDFSATTNREIENQYPTMEVDEIQAIDVAAFCHTDAVLYLWATAPKLREALAVMEAWGFEYKSNMVWIKDKIGMGYWSRNQHEMILIGTRGNFSPPAADKRVSSIIEAPPHKNTA